MNHNNLPIQFSKYGSSILKLSRIFLTIDEGNKMPTIDSLQEQLNVARGTVQNSLKYLKEIKAIEVISRGKLGSFIVKKNMEILLKTAGIDFLLGAMPLPYSKRYEGLSTAIVNSIGKKFGLRIVLSYMLGANTRLNMLENDRCDFAICSLYSAKKAIEDNLYNISIVAELGKYSYLSNHCFVFRKGLEPIIKDGYKLALDKNSMDQYLLTKKYVGNRKVQYINMEYTKILNSLENNEIDCALWNLDEIKERNLNLKYKVINEKNTDDTIATFVVSGKKPEIKEILKKSINKKELVSIQNDVMNSKFLPSY